MQLNNFAEEAAVFEDSDEDSLPSRIFLIS